MARLTQKLHPGPLALDLLDQAGKDLGPSLELQLARLDYWGFEGGDRAKAEVAKLAEARHQVPQADRALFLDRLGAVEIRLGQVGLARRYWRELAVLQPNNLDVRLALFDLALSAADHEEAASLVKEIKNAEGAQGTTWRFMQASLLIDGARRGNFNDLDAARRLTAEITRRRPLWGNGLALSGQIAEIASSPDNAIADYLRAVKLGSTQPSLVRRLMRLLNERNRIDEIKEVTEVLRDQSAALDEIKIVQALEAIRNGQFDQGIALAREVFLDESANSSDHLMLGRLLMTAGRTAEAGKEFRRAVELGRGVPETWLTYVQYLVQTNRIDQAKAAVAAARQALPADLVTLTVAQCLAFVGDARQAEDLIEIALNEEGKSADPAALRIAVTVAQSINRPDKVERFLNKFNRSGGRSASDRAWANRIRVAMLLKQGRSADRDRALALVDENLRIAPDSIDDQSLKAKILALRTDRREDAIAILEQLAGSNRLGAVERFELAQLYLGRGDEQKYQAEMLELLNLKRKIPQHLAHFVTYWIDRNQLDKADRWLAELKTAEPEGVAALVLDARLLDLRHRKGELRELLEARGRQVPDQVGVVAELLEHYGFTTEAEAAYKAFGARDANQPQRILAFAVFLAHQNRVAEAMEILKKAWLTCRPEQVAAVALSVYRAPAAREDHQRQLEAWVAEATRKRPDLVILTAKLGLISMHQGRFDDAEALFRRVLGSEPENVEALSDLAWLLALRDQGRSHEALQLIDRAIQLEGELPSLVDTRAVARIQLGQLDQVVGDLLAIRKQFPRNPGFALHLAWAYHARGQIEQARRELREAEKLGVSPRTLDPLEFTVFQRLRKNLSPG
jgi:tetratricopeptide (TPR) repeat protein